MNNNARERARWKAKLLSWAKKAESKASKPVAKLIAEAVFGILSSGTLILSEIARSLQEPKRLHHTLKRLSRMLSKHDLSVISEEIILEKAREVVTKEMILAIDPGDLNRDGSLKSESICRVRDGSQKGTVNGYPLMEVVARDPDTGSTHPVLCRLYSYSDAKFASENREIMGAMYAVRKQGMSDNWWVIDRGGDRKILWREWLHNGFKVVARVTDKRYWQWRNNKVTAQGIARQLPTKQMGFLKRSSKKRRSVRFGVTRVYLPQCPDYPLTMIVVRHGWREPLVLVTSKPIRGCNQAQRLIYAYIDRWSCEEGYRFSKQGFGLEAVQSRKYRTLQNLISLATLAWALLASEQNRGEQLILLGKRLKDKKQVKFPFYSLLKGWQRLFAQSKTGLYSLLRASSRSCELFMPPTLPGFSKAWG